MMTKELLTDLHKRGIELWTDGEQLHYRAPKGTLTPTLHNQLIQHKTEIIAILQGQVSQASPLRRISRDQEIPLSFAQERLWFIQQLEPDSPAYNIPLAIHIEGPLNVAALKQSLNALVQRHEVLRTTCSLSNGWPIQVINSVESLSLPVVELGQTPASQKRSTALQLLTAHAQKPFDLTQFPILRPLLLQLEAQEYLLLITTHHFLADGLSMRILAKELSEFYKAFLSGAPAALPELPIQYADFAYWQRQTFRDNELDRLLTYWKQVVGDEPPILAFPTDRPRPKVQSFQGAKYPFTLPRPLAENLVSLSRQERVTLFTTLVTVLAMLLERYTHQDKLIISTAVSNRNRPEIEHLIGFFANNLLLRFDLTGDPSFQQLVKRTHHIILEAYSHQDLPFEKLVENLQPKRDLSQNPLFQIMFVLHNNPDPVLKSSDLILNFLEIDNGTAKFDLALEMANTGQGITGVWEYSTELFDTATIERLTEHFRTLIAGIVAEPSQHLSQLPLLTKATYQQLAAWNETQAPYPADRCIHELFEMQAERTPDATALVFEEQCLTYRALNQRANQIAYRLQQLGIQPETPVGICVERSLEMVIGLLGVLKAGGAYVPLDPAYPKERLAFILEDTDVPVILLQEKLTSVLPEHNARIVYLDAMPDGSTVDIDINPVSGVTPDNLAYVIFTSGSTGRPKGIILRHGAFTSLLKDSQRIYNLQVSSRVLQFASFSFDASLWEIFSALSSGATLCLGRLEDLLPGPNLVKLLREQEITLALLSPSALSMLPENELPALKTIIAGTEKCTGEIVARWQPGRQFFNAYGPTETTVYCTLMACTDEYPQGPPIGRPVPNMYTYILDQALQPVPIGVIGELYIDGVGMARGYLKQPSLTAEKFIPNPFSHESGARMYKSGDFARYLADGNIEFLGRIDHQVKIRGFRIELGEIETALMKHPDVLAAAVSAREDQANNKRLVAYVVGRQHVHLSTSELQNFLREKLPTYMVPNVFMFLDELPLTPNKKIDRHRLPSPGEERPVLVEQFVAPRTPAEDMLAGIWAEVLELEQVGIYDDFFNLGGHSLLAVQLINRISETFRAELSVRALFEAPTIAALAKRLDQRQKAEQTSAVPPIQPVSRDGKLPVSFSQQRLWFLEQLEPNNPAYNIPTALNLTGSLNMVALQKSLDEITHRHESLRTTFIAEEGRPIQVVAPPQPVPLRIIDLQGLPEVEREKQANNLAIEEAQRPFNLESGPLFRASLVRLEKTKHLLLLTLHHIISDGWSTNILIREMAALYRAFVAGKPSPLPELPIQYPDFTVWQHSWLRGEALAAQWAYWKRQIGSSPPVVQLPTDRQRPAIQTFRGAVHSFELQAELSQSIKKLGRQGGVTLFMLLLAAFNTLLYRYTGQKDLLVGSPIANRKQREIEELIGFFANTLILRTKLTDNMTFRELLQQTREVALEAYAHQDLPFEMLVEELQPERDLSRQPIFQIMFVFQNAPLPPITLPGLISSPRLVENKTAKFDLLLSMLATEESLVGSFEYNVDLFDEDTVARMARHFQTLLESIIAHPERPISKLPLLTEMEQYQLLVTWNETQVSLTDVSVSRLFEHQVERRPNAIAAVFEDQQVTYYELNQRANRLASFLVEQGVDQEVCVALLAERSIDFLVMILAVFKAGGFYLPLDPRHPPARLSQVLSQSQAHLVLTTSDMADTLSEAMANLPAAKTQKVFVIEELYRQTYSTDNLPTRYSADALAYVIYTSGSTGLPKGAMVMHRGMLNHLYAKILDLKLTEKDIVAQTAPQCFDISVWQFLAALVVGGCVHIFSDEIVYTPGRLLHELISKRISILEVVPSALRAILDELGWQSAEEPISLALRWLIPTGEALMPELCRQWFHYFPNISLVNAYGPTECSDDVTHYFIDKAPTTNVMPIGQPIINTQLYILDSQWQPVPIGVTGELYVGGICVGRGYSHDSKQTAQAFMPDPFAQEPGSRLYRTGDLTRYLPNGDIEFLGRIDHQVKIRGHRIEIGEIEARLEEHAAVRETVIVVRDKEGTVDEKQLVAYVVPHQGLAPTVTELRTFLAERLPAYMVPSSFVKLEALPLTPNGKIDRHSLPAPDPLRPELATVFAAPETEAERAIATIWQEVLQLEKVGMFDNFFDLGGHSLLAAQVHSKLRESFQSDLSIIEIFQYPTVSELAKHLTQKGLAPPTLPDRLAETLQAGKMRRQQLREKRLINR
jgi:amino acid adenylation domain-containing protein